MEMGGEIIFILRMLTSAKGMRKLTEVLNLWSSASQGASLGDVLFALIFQIL